MSMRDRFFKHISRNATGVPDFRRRDLEVDDFIYIQVANNDSKAYNNIVIFNSSNTRTQSNFGLPITDYGTYTLGVTCTSKNALTSYPQILERSEEKPFMCGRFFAEVAYGSSLQLSVNNPMQIIHLTDTTSATGNIYIFKDPYQNNLNSVMKDVNFFMDGSTALIIPTIYANTTLNIAVYPYKRNTQSF